MPRATLLEDLAPGETLPVQSASLKIDLLTTFMPSHNTREGARASSGVLTFRNAGATVKETIGHAGIVVTTDCTGQGREFIVVSLDYHWHRSEGSGATGPGTRFDYLCCLEMAPQIGGSRKEGKEKSYKLQHTEEHTIDVKEVKAIRLATEAESHALHAVYWENNGIGASLNMPDNSDPEDDMFAYIKQLEELGIHDRAAWVADNYMRWSASIHRDDVAPADIEAAAHYMVGDVMGLLGSSKDWTLEKDGGELVAPPDSVSIDLPYNLQHRLGFADLPKVPLGKKTPEPTQSKGRKGGGSSSSEGGQQQRNQASGKTSGKASGKNQVHPEGSGGLFGQAEELRVARARVTELEGLLVTANEATTTSTEKYEDLSTSRNEVFAEFQAFVAAVANYCTVAETLIPSHQKKALFDVRVNLPAWMRNAQKSAPPVRKRHRDHE